MAVAAVVLNRVESSSFPNTISGVIYQSGAFSCVSNGSINNTPDSTAIRAALGERAVILPPNLSDLRADAACVLAAGRRETWMEPARLEPYYLRAPQAERERAERLKKEAGA